MLQSLGATFPNKWNIETFEEKLLQIGECKRYFHRRTNFIKYIGNWGFAPPFYSIANQFAGEGPRKLISVCRLNIQGGDKTTIVKSK